TADAAILYHAGMIAARVPGQSAEAKRLLEQALALNPYFDARQAPAARRELAALARAQRNVAKDELPRAARKAKDTGRTARGKTARAASRPSSRTSFADALR